MKAYSYDIFDTCLIRACGNAEYVFDILADAILGHDCDTSVKVDFALERKRAEKIARKKYISEDNEEISLKDIYSVADFSCYTNCDNNIILNKELEIEKEVLLPVYEIKEEIQELHNKNIPVFFISDMYLPFDFIKEILVRYGFYSSSDRLYVSSQVRKTKRTGNLFRYVMNENSLHPHSWIHSGDDKHNDYFIPRMMGIKCKRKSFKLSYYEQLLFNLDNSNIELGIQKLAYISRAIRLSNKMSSRISFASDFVAPIFVPFVYHILSDASKRGIKHLYFVSRDGYVLLEIAKILIVKFPDIDLDYLRVSRKSLYLLLLDDISFDSISDLFFDINKVGLKDVLDILHMTDYYDNLKSKMEFADTTKVINNLLNDKDFVFELKRRRDEQKYLCSCYFKSIGIYRENSAIVDLTGSLKCHVAINKLIKDTEGHELFGYYLEVLKERVKGTSYDALIYQDRYSYNLRSYKLGPHDIMEQYFTATTQDRTAGYQKDSNGVTPVFESDNTDYKFKEEVFKINNKINIDYSRLYMMILGSQSAKALCYAGISTYSRFLCAPEKEYINALVGLEFSKSKVRKEDVIIKSSILKIIANRKKDWFYGNLVYNSFFPKIMTMLLRLYTSYRIKKSCRYGRL